MRRRNPYVKFVGVRWLLERGIETALVYPVNHNHADKTRLPIIVFAYDQDNRLAADKGIVQFDDAFQSVQAVLIAHRNPQFPQHPVGSDPGNADQLGQEQGRFTSLVRRKPVEENQNNLTISSVVVTSGAFINVAGLQQLQAKPSDHLRLIRVRRQRFSSEKRCWHSQKFVHSACTNALQVICSEFGFFYLVVNL